MPSYYAREVSMSFYCAMFDVVYDARMDTAYDMEQMLMGGEI
jgi:hypothetical protein